MTIQILDGLVFGGSLYFFTLMDLLILFIDVKKTSFHCTACNWSVGLYLSFSEVLSMDNCVEAYIAFYYRLQKIDQTYTPNYADYLSITES